VLLFFLALQLTVALVMSLLALRQFFDLIKLDSSLGAFPASLPAAPAADVFDELD
jgi:hypothetical protein